MQSDAGDFSYLDDPAFLDERARVRRRLEHVPENAVGRRELERVYETMTAEVLPPRADRVDETTGENRARG